MNQAIDLIKESEEHERQLRQLNKSLYYCGGETPVDYIDYYTVLEGISDVINLTADPDDNFWSDLFSSLFRSSRKGRRSRSSWGWLFEGLLNFLGSFLFSILYGRKWFLRELGGKNRRLRLARIVYRLRRRRKTFLRIAKSIQLHLWEITRVIDVRAIVTVFLKRILPLNDDEDSNIVNSASAKGLHVVSLIINYEK